MSKPKHILQAWSPLGSVSTFILAHGLGTWMSLKLTHGLEHLPAVWLPSGVLLTALLLARWRHWPLFFLIALAVGPLTSLSGHWPPAVSLLVSASNGFAALVGAYLLRRHAGLRPSLERMRDMLALLLIAVLGPVLSAVPSILMLVVHENLTLMEGGALLRVFWVGDTLGMLMMTPALLTWGRKDAPAWSPAREVEFGVLLLSLVCTLHLGFLWATPSPALHHPLTYTAFPFILWAALRFEARGTSLALLALATVSLLHTLQGSGPFALEPGGSVPLMERLLYLQSFLVVSSASGLLLATAVGELRRARQESELLNAQLRTSLEELATTQRELVRRERMAAVGELSASVAHEVRNPLGAIANAVATLVRISRPEGNSTTWELLGVMGEEVERLDMLITGLVDFARPLEPRLLTQALGPVVEGALESALRAEPRPLALHVTRALDTSLPDAPLDAQLLHRALINLFHNAIQAMPTGGTLRVELSRLEKTPGPPQALITISDTGPGIPPDAMKRLFEPFFTTKALGTGLGLAIVRAIVEAHRGQVEVRSTLGQGSTFTLRLPLSSGARAPASAGSLTQKGMPSSSLLPPL
ncbi:MAG: MASE1 domain-containing protein [Cystobacter sp.]